MENSDVKLDKAVSRESPRYASLENRVILITGAGAGIGRAVALLCAEQGARIAVADIDGDRCRLVAEEALERGARATIGIYCDVAVEHDVERAFAACQNDLGSVYGVFANAGKDLGGMTHELAVDIWENVLATNLTGIYLTCKSALRSMLVHNLGGSIVCTSSPAAFVGFAAGGAGAYSASKGGISALVRCLAVDYARYGIRVNAVVPGPTETRLMWANVPDAQLPEMRQRISTEVPLGRLADPSEPARAVLWLLSDQASYVTGSHLVCDGGVLAKAAVSV